MRHHSASATTLRYRVILGALQIAASLAILPANGCGPGEKVLLPRAPLQHVLFVGDSFTHGRYLPVRLYNSGGSQDGTTGSPLVFDENYGATGAREESTTEYGPYGGIPGIFAELASEAGLPYDVHIEAISMTSLHENYAEASAIIDQAKWNAVILQELSSRPLPSDLSGDPTSDPESFCKSVQTIEAGIHAVAPGAHIYLYETWPRADLAQQLAGSISSPGFSSAYQLSLQNLGYANHNAYYSAAAHDGAIAGIAPAGDAWSRAWAHGIANSNPFSGSSSLPLLWYGFHELNEPKIRSPDYLHPSIYGAYLNGLVLFQEITGKDVKIFGDHEAAAIALGVPGPVAVQLQQIAWEAVTLQDHAPVHQVIDPCTVTH